MFHFSSLKLKCEMIWVPSHLGYLKEPELRGNGK